MATLEIGNPVRSSAMSRLDRLPIGPFHKMTMWLIAYVFFFELGDLNTFAFAAPVLRQQWHLSIAGIGVITSAAFIGMFLGGTMGGWFSDKVGRKKALLFTTVCYSGFSLLNAFVWNETGLFITRFFTGVGLSAMTVVAITYISEMFPAKRRGAYQGWIMVIGLFGIPITANVAEEAYPPKRLWMAVGVCLGCAWAADPSVSPGRWRSHRDGTKVKGGLPRRTLYWIA